MGRTKLIETPEKMFDDESTSVSYDTDEVKGKFIGMLIINRDDYDSYEDYLIAIIIMIDSEKLALRNLKNKIGRELGGIG